ncbi:MAG: HPr family phosphocarrier protein [Oligoflexia bacterium]|nr:HPr family phosphocarrier protein [Oligoflexia bacterium]
MERVVEILNETGLHARPAGILVKAASSFKSNIEIKTEKAVVNAKSIMSVLSLGLTKGSKITIIAHGEDEEIALNSLVALIEKKFEQ